LINSLSLKNFRSYKDTFVEFCPGVNCIIGENDSGKTNLLRAINLIANNRPSGEDFRSSWGGDTVAAIDTDNKLVSRVRTDKENAYTLSGEKEPFKAFGKGVPDIIKQHLNMSPVNIAFQLDGPFLLGMSDADVAKHYNNAVNLDIIDRAVSNIASTLRQEKSSLKVIKATEEKKTEELKEYDWLPDAEVQVIKLENLQQNIINSKNDWSKLYDLTDDLKKQSKASLELERITRFEPDMLQAIDKRNEITILKNNYKQLKELVLDLILLNNNIEMLNQIVQHKNKTDIFIEQANEIDKAVENENILKDYVKQLSEYLKAEKQYEEIVKYTDYTKALLDLSNVIDKEIQSFNEIQKLLQKQIELNQEYKNLEFKLNKLQSEFTKILPDKCPIFSVKCKHINLKKQENIV